MKISAQKLTLFLFAVAGVFSFGCSGGGTAEVEDSFMPGITAPNADVALIHPYSESENSEILFADVGVEVTRNYVLRNTGTRAATNILISAPLPFTIKSSECQSSLLKSQSCSILVAFTPTNRDRVSATLTIQYNNYAHIVTETQELIGMGRNADLTFSDGSVYTFGALDAMNSATQTFTVSNAGNKDAAIHTITAPSFFTVSNSTCGAVLNASATCEISVTYAPTLSGTHDGNLSITYAATSRANSTVTRSLQATANSSWTWIAGSNIYRQRGTYGTKGTAAPGNVPGARANSVSWTDTLGNFWLFGGGGYDSAGMSGGLNDLWKFNGTQWTWVAGSNMRNQIGTYGTLGVANPSNIPGARSGGKSWTDASGNLWLFGGRGYDSAGNAGYLNDLWKFDGTQWTWISGSNLRNQRGTHGSSSPVPGGRAYFVSWSDNSGNLWLFGGAGYDSSGDWGKLNDLWKFNGTDWTWVGGSDRHSQQANHGTKGVANAANIPGARYGSTGVRDDRGNFWLFGGLGYEPVNGEASWNDLWKFDGTHWIWVSGSSTGNAAGVYGTKGIAAATNVPGARYGAFTWCDSSGDLWLFGGEGEATTFGYLNDLWKFDGSQWTWVSGSDVGDAGGVHGTLNIPSASNIPSGRDSLTGWRDSNGHLWLFGGGGWGPSNDLWRFAP